MYGSSTSPIIETLIDGTWTDVSTRPSAEQKIVITRGRANEQAFVPAVSEWCVHHGYELPNRKAFR